MAGPSTGKGPRHRLAPTTNPPAARDAARKSHGRPRRQRAPHTIRVSKAANQALSKKYEIRGYPTIIVLDAGGKELFKQIVLVDDKEVRAVMTASWLRQMGWTDVFVLVASGGEEGIPDNPVLGAPARDAAIKPVELDGLLARNEATVVDLSLSRNYATTHISGAWFAIRSRLAQFIQKTPLRRHVVLTSEDGVLAGLAVNEARPHTPLPIRYLAGGNSAWRAAGFPLTAESPLMADEPIDAWLKPYERPDGAKQAMADYLAWETDLLPCIGRDGCAMFLRFP